MGWVSQGRITNQKASLSDWHLMSPNVWGCFDCSIGVGVTSKQGTDAV